jgi:hypothetical protein
MLVLIAAIAWAVMRSKREADEMVEGPNVAPVGEQV